MKRTGILLLAVVAATATLSSATPAEAQGYVEQKDNDAIGVIERALAKVDKNPALFDGKAIPPGADLTKVGELATRLNSELDVARRHIDQLSAAGRARPNVAAMMTRWNDLATYARALVPVYNAAAAAASDAAARKATADAAAKDAGSKACAAFRKELLADPTELERLHRVTQISDGVITSWQTVEDGGKHKATLAKAAALCARPEFARIGTACSLGYGPPPEEPGWCAAAARADEVMKQAARNLASDFAQRMGPARTAENLADKDGWIDIEGPVTWADYFSGKKQRDLIMKQLAPVFAQAGLTTIDDLDVFKKLEAHYAALAVKVKELAPGWDLPGKACAGAGCAAAKKSAAAWYPKGKLRKVLQNQAAWTVVQNGLGIPTHRYKSGFVLIEVKGDPMCQLRSWTASEKHQGGGRYQAATGAQIGYVRWQPCR